ncbi:hypothetical protein PspMM1_37740 [Pseudoalteromonas sp. MM1]|uniref:hypothetical protein n=1 Tax=Pseudoalteromonas sp. MM1 TaxID=3036714 RepID=UPI00257465F7|nr:hypothetical protein [Pseudoalteromonas sp. MM1]BED91306.1 hypothetical protein PspMM1_37740 [Pseudoalteromonas sp. MM1]
MYKTLSSGLIAFCFLNSLSAHAAVSQRVNKSSLSEVNLLLNQSVGLTNKASTHSYFIELDTPQAFNVKQTRSSAKKMQQFFAGVPIWGAANTGAT